MSAWAVRGMYVHTIILSDGVSDQASGTMEAWGASKDGPPVPVPRYSPTRPTRSPARMGDTEAWALKGQWGVP